MIVFAAVIIRIKFGYSNNPDLKTKFSESDNKVISSVFDINENTFEVDKMTYISEHNTESYNVFVKLPDISQFEENYGLKKQDYYSVSEEYPYMKDSNISCMMYAWDDDSYTLWFKYKGHNAELSELLNVK